MIGGFLQVKSLQYLMISFAHATVELQMRRPNKDRYRLDRLLERKAKEGVKIYVIL